MGYQMVPIRCLLNSYAAEQLPTLAVTAVYLADRVRKANRMLPCCITAVSVGQPPRWRCAAMSRLAQWYAQWHAHWLRYAAISRRTRNAYFDQQADMLCVWTSVRLINCSLCCEPSVDACIALRSIQLPSCLSLYCSSRYRRPSWLSQLVVCIKRRAVDMLLSRSRA